MKTNGDVEALIKRVQEHVIINDNENDKQLNETYKDLRHGRPYSMYATMPISNEESYSIKESPDNTLSKKNNDPEIKSEQSDDNKNIVESSVNKNRNRYSYPRKNSKRASMVVTQPVILEDEIPTYESINVKSAPHNRPMMSRTRKVIDFFKRRSMRI